MDYEETYNPFFLRSAEGGEAISSCFLFMLPAAVLLSSPVASHTCTFGNTDEHYAKTKYISILFYGKNVEPLRGSEYNYTTLSTGILPRRGKKKSYFNTCKK